ncbi:binding-protein-dependent transport system inner membrane protein [Caballeronia arvi]|uniref:Binding-protein-dependent transport system inner membrane protein n=1 Tax=Caballeronia arvi TaxID=1777135 RepID=A0A158KVV3_9BURK|nr:ABC transporter permease [Caballeronia arvi]SAL85298.1 binding-protein-dependent transport system inner membrane protein [Caballeronia arvi]
MSTSYLIKRLGLSLYTLFLVSAIVFLITQVLPADPAVMLLGENATPDALNAIRQEMGLDKPVYAQYVTWLMQVLHGNLGLSMRTGEPVASMMFDALGRSLTLAVFSIVFMLAVSIPLGVVAAVRRGKAADFIVSIVSYAGVSLPEFVTASVFALVLADYLHLLPAAGYVPIFDDPARAIPRLILPVLTISVILVAHVSRMVRSELVDVLHTDYIRAARLKGLSRQTVLFKHGLRNALLPTITIVALDVGYLLGGVIVVEEIFAIPGIGRQLIVAIQTRDLPAIQAGALIMAGTYCIVNLVADMTYAALDKRIRYE